MRPASGLDSLPARFDNASGSIRFVLTKEDRADNDRFGRAEAVERD